MTPEPFVGLGRVVKTHGLKGEVSVAMAEDLPFAFPEGIEVWFTPPPAGVRSGRVEAVREGSRGPLVKIAGIDHIDDAAALVGREIVAKATDLPEGFAETPEEDDPIGLQVTDAERGFLGEVVEVIVTGANDVWVVDGPLGEVLLPVIDDVVREVDWDAGTVAVTALPGLLPEEGEEA
jgi:16S rRNA processing protein RimM